MLQIKNKVSVSGADTARDKSFVSDKVTTQAVAYEFRSIGENLRRLSEVEGSCPIVNVSSVGFDFAQPTENTTD